MAAVMHTPMHTELCTYTHVEKLAEVRSTQKLLEIVLLYSTRVLRGFCSEDL